MQICNKYNLLALEQDLNKPDRAKDVCMETPSNSHCRDAAVGMELSVCLRLPTAVLPQSTGWPVIGRYFFLQQMGGYPCQSFRVMPLWPLGAPWEGARLLTPAEALSQGHMGLVFGGYRTNLRHRPVLLTQTHVLMYSTSLSLCVALCCSPNLSDQLIIPSVQCKNVYYTFYWGYKGIQHSPCNDVCRIVM